MISLRSLLFFTFAPGAVWGAQKRSTSESFELWAYGDDIGGMPVFFADGYAFAGSSTQANSSEAADVIFSPTEDSVWKGSPNATTTTNGTMPSWNNVTLFVPNSAGGRVGFLNSTASADTSQTTEGFLLYGSTAMMKGSSGLDSMWTGLQTETGEYALYWNDTSQGQVVLNLRTVAPSNGK